MKPIGQILRERREANKIITKNVPKEPALSLEEQIRLLEEDIGGSEEGSSDDGSSDEGSSDDDSDDADKEDSDKEEEEETMVYEKDEKGNIIRIISKIYDDKIEPLSEGQLPQFMCSKGSKGKPSFNLLKQLNPLNKDKNTANNRNKDDGDEIVKKTVVRFADDMIGKKDDNSNNKSNENDKNDDKKDKKDNSVYENYIDNKVLTKEEIEMQEEKKRQRQERKEKKSRPRNEEESEKKEVETVKKARVSGLEKTVRELLMNYIPQSVEKKAFFCRICRVESVCIDSFELHKLSELHDIAAKMEKKMSFCSLCRKQFTSPAQLKEHIQGKGHKDYLVVIKEKQLQQKNMKKFK